MANKYYTDELGENQYLIIDDFRNTEEETFCKGFTDDERDRNLDGYYLNSDLKQLI